MLCLTFLQLLKLLSEKSLRISSCKEYFHIQFHPFCLLIFFKSKFIFYIVYYAYISNYIFCTFTPLHRPSLPATLSFSHCPSPHFSQAGPNHIHYILAFVDFGVFPYVSVIHVSQSQQEAFNHYRKNTMSIEILKDDHLQKVNFRVKNKVRKYPS